MQISSVIRFKIFLAITSVILVSCGNFEAAQHPDDIFREGRGLGSIQDLDRFVSGVHSNPKYRDAEVTTESTGLKLKVRPSSNSPSPANGPNTISKGTRVLVYWPTDINNNHIKIFYQQQTLWVTYRSSSGKKYITLLEELSVNTVTTAGAGIIKAPAAVPVTGGDLVTLPSSLEVRRVTIPQTVLDEALMAVRKFSLTPANVPTCSFDPLIGNSSSGENCYERVVISQDFKNFVAQHGNSCAVKAAQETFSQRPKKVIFHTAYSSGSLGQVRRDRKVSGSGKYSIHATGQAFDLFAMSLIFDSGTRRVTLHKEKTDGSSTEERQNHSFYWKYVRCWQERIKQHSPCNCDSTLAGAITYLYDSAHHNHIHISLPFCERNSFNVSCV